MARLTVYLFDHRHRLHAESEIPRLLVESASDTEPSPDESQDCPTSSTGSYGRLARHSSRRSNRDHPELRGYTSMIVRSRRAPLLAAAVTVSALGVWALLASAPPNNGATTTVTKTVTVTAPTIGATFNVRDFGAVGNGTVDDTAAFRAAITAGAGKTVLIPDGTFRISAPVTVPAGTTMTGTGTIHQTSAGRSGLVLSGSGVTVEGVTLLGSRTSNVYAGGEDAIRGAGASTGSPLTNIMIRSVTISGWGAHGVYLQYVKGFTVSGSNVHDVGYAGIGVMSGFDGSISGNRVDNITPGTATNMYGIFLSYSGDGGVTDPPSARVVVDGNTVSRVAWQGINSHAGSNLTITNNHVNACTSGVFIAGTGTTGLIISGNVIDNLADTAPDATGKAILVMGSLAAPASGEINNNIIRRSKWVLLQNTQGLVVSGNTFDRSNPSGILLNGHNTSFAITGNTFTDMWSDAENTAGIQSSESTNKGLIEGNTLRMGTKTAQHLNSYGLHHDGLAGITLRSNDFAAATEAPIAGTVQVGDRPITVFTGTASMTLAACKGRPVLPLGHLLDQPVSDPGHGLLGHTGTGDLGEVRTDLAGRQTPAVNDGTMSSTPSDGSGAWPRHLLERANEVPRHLDVHRPGVVGGHRLGPGPLPTVPGLGWRGCPWDSPSDRSSLPPETPRPPSWSTA